MLTLKTPAEAERFVRRQQRLAAEDESTSDVRWDNYDMVFFRESPKGLYSKDGAFRNGVWGFENRVPVSDSGTWEVDHRNVRRSGRARD